MLASALFLLQKHLKLVAAVEIPMHETNKA